MRPIEIIAFLPGSPMSDAVTTRVITGSVSLSKVCASLMSPVVRLILNSDKAEKGVELVSAYLTIPLTPTVSLSLADTYTWMHVKYTQLTPAEYDISYH